MKRYRAMDVPPKFRRAVKGRSTRLGESVYFNRFFSAYNLVYLKFFLMWVGCITLDFLIGFRFELLWPVWLLIRHLYESFRVHAFSSSLHYSAFSVFFVCVTATSDLVCYLFIPIQVLIFLASTYVWVQFVYQSSDRGICLPSLFLWALFIVFEYSVRYRFDNATWYLARTSWITAGLFPSTADSVTVGSPSSTTASASSTRLELYRPFAAHCIGFPVVTLGFRVKSFFSNWRMRVRREEVRRQNEFYERILADAIPTSFENRKHFISSRNHLSVEQQDTIEYDSGGFTASELLNGLDTNGQPRLYANSGSLAAICAPTATSQFTMQQQNYTTSTSSSVLLKKPQRLTKQNTSNTLKQQNGSAASKKNGVMGKTWRQDANSFITKGQNVTTSLEQQKNSTLLFNEETILHKVCRTAFRFCCLFVLSTFGQLISIVQPSFQQTLEGLLAQLRGNSTNQDDLISTSGEGSNAAEEDEWEQESNHFQTNFAHGANPTGGKRKSRRPRGLSSISQTSVNTANDYTGQQTAVSTSLRPTGSTSSVYNTTMTGGKILAEINGELSNFATSPITPDVDVCEFTLKLNELKHIQKEKQTMEQSIEKLKIELKCARNSESELRTQLQHVQQQEQNSRNEIKQLEREQKQRSEQLENRCRQLSKQNDHFKTNIQALEKRVGELQLKKLEIERELANERLMKQHATDQHGSNKTNTHDSTEQFKQKLANMDRELKSLKREMKAKDEICTKLEEETRQLRSTTGVENKQMEALRQKNFLLEQTLSAENRLKQDLFRALNDSKAEIASIKAQLRVKQTKEQTDMMNAFSSGNSLFHNATSATGSASSTGSSPTQQQQFQQFPTLSQQKSMTPPPLSVASSTFNLEQLLQATQNMSYSLGPINSNGSCNENSYANEYGSGGTSSPYGVGDGSEMLVVGGHRSNNNNIGSGKNCGNAN